ncbi:hypothetical protein H6P81_000558 [Aristolochia fimbriata]|uniref:Uncharacterized protein n=1 Tax=Aristolochia fimbriata TaxID=158543 RepID=A0AAV7F4F0_ARIFI|nr:hypothetical protein H6P81_000558 [Aristolochia fimbriata]
MRSAQIPEENSPKVEDQRSTDTQRWMQFSAAVRHFRKQVMCGLINTSRLPKPVKQAKEEIMDRGGDPRRKSNQKFLRGPEHAQAPTVLIIDYRYSVHNIKRQSSDSERAETCIEKGNLG